MNWRRFFRRDEADAEQREELDFYVDVTAEEYIERGMEPAEARAAARRKLGNTDPDPRGGLSHEHAHIPGGPAAGCAPCGADDPNEAGIQHGGFAFAGFGHRREYRNFQRIERGPDSALALPRIGRAGGRIQQDCDSGTGLRRCGAVGRHVRCLQGERKGL